MDHKTGKLDGSSQGKRAELVLQRYKDECHLLALAVDELINRLGQLQVSQENLLDNAAQREDVADLEQIVLRLVKITTQLASRTSADLDAVDVTEESRQQILAQLDNLMTLLRKVVLTLAGWKTKLGMANSDTSDPNTCQPIVHYQFPGHDLFRARN